MIGQEHISLDGELYKLAEGAEGTHYDLAGEPLRPPNAIGVQGEQGKFQVRPDLLLWKLTDWSGGEGQIKFNSQEPSKHRELSNVEVFTEPGKLMPGPYATETTFAAAATFAKNVLLTRAMNGLWACDQDSKDIFEWDDTNSVWLAAVSNGSQTNGPMNNVCGDGDSIYYHEHTTQDVWKYDGSTFTNISTGLVSASTVTWIAELGPYVYIHRAAEGRVWEIAKTGATGILLDQPNYVGGDASHRGPSIVTGDNRLYTMLRNSGDTIIREITPTSAAGAGYGAEIARLTSFEGEAMWWANGTLFIAGAENSDADEKTVMYIRPGESFGSIGRLRQGYLLDDASGAVNSGRMLDHGFLTRDVKGLTVTSASFAGLWLIDSVSGGVALLSSTSTAAFNNTNFGPVAYKGRYFWSGNAGTGHRTWYTGGGEYHAANAKALSPMHDFDVSDEKVLSSISVIVEDAVPTDWTIRVGYGLDKELPDIFPVAMTSSDGARLNVVVSSAVSPRTFHNLSLMVTFLWSGGGVPTTRPKILAVEARAQLAKKPERWRYLIDVTDQHSAGVRSYNGAKKIAKLKTAIAKSVVELIDGYSDRDPKVSDTHAVVVDNYRFILDRPGEGLAYIELVEVL